MRELVNIVSGKVVASGDQANRCTGRTTGQALNIIGTAMCNPGKGIIVIDHHDCYLKHEVTVGRVATTSLICRMIELINAAKIRGLTVTNDGRHNYLTYTPLVPLEQVVKEWYESKRAK